jgi:hypothetical protein
MGKEYLENRVMRYWKSFHNDTNNPARVPEFIRIKSVSKDYVVYEKHCKITTYHSPTNKMLVTKIVPFGGGAVSFKELDKAEGITRAKAKAEENFARSYL